MYVYYSETSMCISWIISASEMTYIVSGGGVKLYSLTHSSRGSFYITAIF